MPRSLCVHPNYLDRVKLARRRNGYLSQRALAEDTGFALSTVSNFLTGKPVDFSTFEELCRRLALDWKEIAFLDVGSMAKTINFEPDLNTTENNPISPPLYPNGSIPLDSPFYLERIPIEAQIKQEIRKPGALIRIKAPRERGKTSLLMRILEEARNIGYKTVSLNLERVEQSILADLSQFLRLFCANAARQLQLKPNLDEYWDEDLGNKISCTAYIEDYLLESVQTPIVLALDEVNQLFEHPQVAKDFLPLLRSWHEESKTRPIWQKLRLIVVHSTEIYVPLQLNQSPFNVGLPVQLNPFNLAEVTELAQRYGLNWENEEEAQQLMELVDGHPVLVQMALYHLSLGEMTLTQLLETASTSAGIYASHLRRYRVIIEGQPELAQALFQVFSANEPVLLDSLLSYKLSSMGLIKLTGDKAIPSNQLYKQHFLRLNS
jgi:transcriptional regulator with XRE-family HTH domain